MVRIVLSAFDPAIRRALDGGVTVNELKEAFSPSNLIVATTGTSIMAHTRYSSVSLVAAGIRSGASLPLLSRLA